MLVSRLNAEAEAKQIKREIVRPQLPPGVLPPDVKTNPKYGAYVAQDSAIDGFIRYANEAFCGLGFPGYPYLSELSQRSEYRAATETTAREMTRKWIRFTSTGDGENEDKLAELRAAFDKHKVQDVFRLASMHDGFFGRGQIYIKIKGQDSDEARANPLVIDKRTIEKGSLLGFKNIEPLWTTPNAYNSIDPARDDFFVPTSWFVIGKLTHATRLLTFIAREVPDMLKPAYNFGGLSMTQLMEPYVDAWLRTRSSISDLLHSFSISGLATDMSTILADSASGDQLFLRAELFNKIRDNRGLMITNKDSEEFFQFNTPLSGLSELQAQSQEQMASPSHTPLVKLLGVTPSGLNANSDGEIQVYYDFLHAEQEAQYRHHLTAVMQIIELDLWGEIDDAIGFEFEPLEAMTEKELAEIRKSDADAAVAYINAGVLAPEEERTRLAADENSGYNDLNPDELPEPPDDPDDPKLKGGLDDA